MTTTPDKAGRSYWDQTWEGHAPPPRMDPDATHLSAIVDRSFHGFFTEAFAGMDPAHARPPLRLVEIGCGASVWLPYFARRFGFAVAGVDYSDVGVAQARAILASEGVEGEVVNGDLFAPPPAFEGAFDVVVSNGVVEHFEDTAAVLDAVARFARPGGLVVTVIPNLSGAIGAAQKVLDRAIYDVHVPLDRERLRRAHEDAGLRVERCDYFLSTHFGICNASRAPGRVLGPLKRGLARVLVDASRLVWAVETRTRPFPPGALLAGYVVALARRP